MIESSSSANFNPQIQTVCLVCHAEVAVPAELATTVIVCEKCSLPNVPGGVIKYLLRTEMEQFLIRQQGRRACAQNARAYESCGVMYLKNPYELHSENWHLWKEGYLQELHEKGSLNE